MFKIKKLNIPNLKDPIFVEGLPGMGNVGKVAIDFLIDNTNAKKVVEIISDEFPHSVFVNEDNVVELPYIEIFHKKIKNTDFLFLSGDVQPITEKSCYEFCELVLDFLEKHKCREIITLGGIGLHKIPKKPKVYCAGNKKNLLSKYKKFGAIDGVYGLVGPIVGVSGLLLGLAKERDIPAVTLLAETLGHPGYLGIEGARSMIKVLEKKLDLKLDIKRLDDEIKELENEINFKSIELTRLMREKKEKVKKIRPEQNYIG